MFGIWVWILGMGNNRAVANAERMLAQRKHEERVVGALARRLPPAPAPAPPAKVA